MTGQLETIMMPVVLRGPVPRAVSHRESDLSRVKRCRGVLRMPPGALVPRTNLEIRFPTSSLSFPGFLPPIPGSDRPGQLPGPSEGPG